MSDAQTSFNTFHRTIRLDPDDNEMLREKRDTLLNNLAEKIDSAAPDYTTFHQGSYSLSTGVSPLNGDPDMDIGIIFNCSPEEYPDPVKLKRFVKNALDHNNRTVRIRTPCVTVEYMKGDERVMHIDLAIYCTDSAGVTQLARGRDTDAANTKFRYWEISKPKELNTTIIDAFKGTDREQWRRVVRYLKRWRDIKIGHKNIPSIALTVEAMQQFSPVSDKVDGKDRDLIAMRDMLNRILGRWTSKKLVVQLPVAPYCDLLKDVTEIQMADFKTKLAKLRDVLNDADKEADTHEACKLLRGQFGDEFPVPEKNSTTQKTTQAIQCNGLSA
jgi:hypothetical protein